MHEPPTRSIRMAGGNRLGLAHRTPPGAFQAKVQCCWRMRNQGSGSSSNPQQNVRVESRFGDEAEENVEALKPALFAQIGTNAGKFGRYYMTAKENFGSTVEASHQSPFEDKVGCSTEASQV